MLSALLVCSHLVGVNMYMYTEFCGVHSWQNGTRCRNGMEVLWCLTI